MINLKSRKDVHILVGEPKRRVKPILVQGETHVKEEPQQPTFQPIGVNSQATTLAENNGTANVKEDVVVPNISVHNMAKEKQQVQPVATQ